jgi:hypothetical protein
VSDHTLSAFDFQEGTAWCTCCERRVTVEFVKNGVAVTGVCPNDRNRLTWARIAAKAKDASESKQSQAKTKRGHPERDIQAAIVEALELAGCSCMQTSAWRQKGPSGITKGIPDLLVRWPGLAAGLTLGIEVKSLTGKLSPEQVQAQADGFSIGVARSAKDALTLVAERMDYTVPESVRLRIREVLRGLS